MIRIAAAVRAAQTDAGASGPFSRAMCRPAEPAGQAGQWKNPAAPGEAPPPPGGKPLIALPYDPVVAGLDVHVVGGAVRDALLGLPAGDRDWVVVGSTPEQMAQRGFLPVGGDFPVFLHPVTKEEYALARTERKSGRGYKGFTFHCGVEVSLQDDLKRRDLTVNAIALAPDGRLTDPFDGQGDLRRRVLRHVGEAFSEDPVRLLRLARFAARFADFTIAPQTLALARDLVDAGEVDALVPERVWREVEKSLRTAHPGRFFQVLAQVDALARVMPGLCLDDAVIDTLDVAARRDLPVPGRFALLCRRSAQPGEIAQHLRAPGEHRDQAVLLPLVLARLADMRDAAGDARIEARLELIERCDALRKPERFQQVLAAADCVTPVAVSDWQGRLAALRGMDAGAVARSVTGPDAIRQALRQARLQVLMQAC